MGASNSVFAFHDLVGAHLRIEGATGTVFVGVDATMRSSGLRGVLTVIGGGKTHPRPWLCYRTTPSAAVTKDLIHARSSSTDGRRSLDRSILRGRICRTRSPSCTTQFRL